MEHSFGVTPPWYRNSEVEFAAFNCSAQHQQILDDFINKLFADYELALWFSKNWESISDLDGEPVTEDDLIYIIHMIREG